MTYMLKLAGLAVLAVDWIGIAGCSHDNYRDGAVYVPSDGYYYDNGPYYGGGYYGDGYYYRIATTITIVAGTATISSATTITAGSGIETSIAARAVMMSAAMSAGAPVAMWAGAAVGVAAGAVRAGARPLQRGSTALRQQEASP